MNLLKKYIDRFALALILLLAGFLSIFGIWNEGYGNEFYAACVKSMIQSWHNFFFASLDPGGWVTVDKPPIALWVQAIFAKVFGFSGVSIILPECLAAVATVAILYHIVKRHFGKIAGLISAFALAISPIFIAVSKTNNMDSILILFMVLSMWAMMIAADKGQLRYLILSMVLLGVAYNTKMLQAFLIAPALYATYFFATNIKLKKRVWHLAVAAVVLAAVSLSWSIIVDLTPADQRPYVDNSTSNSELQLAIGYNGIQRVTGKMSFGGGASSENKDSKSQIGQDYVSRKDSNGISSKTDNTQRDAISNRSKSDSNTFSRDFEMNGGTMAGGFSGGSKGILRMFSESLGGQDSWLLPFALFAILALILRRRKSYGEDTESRRVLLSDAILWGVSVITMVIYFSIAGFSHQYYIATLAPSVAALTGIGVVQMWKLYKSDGLASFMLPVAIAVTIIAQVAMLSYYPSFAVVMIPLVLVFAGIPVVVLFVSKLMRKELAAKAGLICASICIAGLLIAPAVWSFTPLIFGVSTSSPVAGPSASYGNQGGQTGKWGQSTGRNDGSKGYTTDETKQNRGSGFGNAGTSNTKLTSFLVKNNTGEKFLVAVPTASTAEPIILATGKPVMAVGGFSGNDKTLTVAKLESMVKSGQIKYYLVSSGGMRGSSSNELTNWIEAHGTVVPQSEWSNNTSSSNSPENSQNPNNSQVLYDLSKYKNESK